MNNESLSNDVKNDTGDSFQARVVKVALLDSNGAIIHPSGQSEQSVTLPAGVVSSWAKVVAGDKTTITLNDSVLSFPSAPVGGITAYGMAIIDGENPPNVHIPKAFETPITIAEGQNATLPATFKLEITHSPVA